MSVDVVAAVVVEFNVIAEVKDTTDEINNNVELLLQLHTAVWCLIIGGGKCSPNLNVKVLLLIVVVEFVQLLPRSEEFG